MKKEKVQEKIKIDPIELNVAERRILESFVDQKGAGLELINKIIDHYMMNLIDIRNVDPEGNMGLQTLARQHAYVILEEIFGTIYSDVRVTQKTPEPTNQWK